MPAGKVLRNCFDWLRNQIGDGTGELLQSSVANKSRVVAQIEFSDSPSPAFSTCDFDLSLGRGLGQAILVSVRFLVLREYFGLMFPYG